MPPCAPCANPLLKPSHLTPQLNTVPAHPLRLQPKHLHHGALAIPFDDTVDVTTDKGQVRVNAGEGTTVKGRQFAPSRPGKWKAERRERMRQKVFLKRRELVQQRMGKAQERHQLMRERFKQYMLQHRKGQLLQQRKNGQQLQPGQRKPFQPGQNLRKRFGQ